jgi:hypothetical protein
MRRRSVSVLAGTAALAASASLQAADLNDRDQAFVAYAQPAIAIVHANVIDGTGGAAKSDQTR